MKTIIIAIITSALLAACSQSGGGSSSGGTSPSPQALPAPAPTPPPSPTPAPTPVPSPSPAPCAPFMETHWIADGSPTLTAGSQDQAGQGAYVSDFDLSILSPTFIESQYSAGSTITCSRIFDAGMPVGGDPQSLSFTDTTGNCVAVAPWFQFDTSVCNKMTVVIRTGTGIVYETQDYKPL